jgi:hypothetical protein
MATHKRDVLLRTRAVSSMKLEEKTLDEQHADAARQPGSSGIHAATADRWRRIANAAYLRAERRGFAGDAELEDWLEAEKEVDQQLTREAIAKHSPQGT